MRVNRRFLIGIAFLALFFISTPVAAAETARGVVYEDLNGDGRYQDTEPGVPGVTVSNGFDVTDTDADGRYRIAIEEGDTLFITKPSGWAVPSSSEKLPRFYYHHAPNGAPADRRPRYRGIAPSGPLPDSIDFPLTRRPEPARFTSVWFADPQPQTMDEVEFIRDDVVAELIGIDAAFGITLGDITYDDLSLYPRLYRNTAQIGVPWYHVPGNHDINKLAETDAESLDTFRRNFGPSYYSFDYAQVHFVVLDTVMYEGTSLGSDDPDPLGSGPYTGGMGERQLAWLANDLRRVPMDRLVVLAMHIPLHSETEPEEPRVNVADRQQLFEILAGRERLLALAGHMHLAEHYYFDSDAGFDGPVPLHLHTLSAVCGSWWSGPLDPRGVPTSLQRDGSPRGYYLMDVDGTQATLRFKATGKPSDHQMRITLDPGFPRSSADIRRDYRHGELLGNRFEMSQLWSTRVLVNLFEGGPRSMVEYQIGEAPATEMYRVVRTDPFIEELIQREGDTMKSWVEAMPTTHMWEAPLPEGLQPGAHTITVRATDEYGRIHIEHKLFEIYAMAPLEVAVD
jgi:3',5'-cyclic AMP phosphodiesterase CpdA